MIIVHLHCEITLRRIFQMVGNFYDNYLLVAVLAYATLLVTQARNPPECAVGETYVLHENTRRPITCPPGSIQDGSECISQLSYITGIVSGAFSQDLSSEMKDKFHLDDFLLEARLMGKICKILDTFNITYQNLNVTVDIKHDNQTFTLQTGFIATVTSACCTMLSHLLQDLKTL